jgi:hypothetical protein
VTSSFLEIVELSDGEIVLQQADNAEDGPLVTIRFSDESRAYMMNACLDVAKVMIQAGIQAAIQISDQGELEEEALSEIEADGGTVTRVLH